MTASATSPSPIDNMAPLNPAASAFVPCFGTVGSNTANSMLGTQPIAVGARLAGKGHAPAQQQQQQPPASPRTTGDELSFEDAFECTQPSPRNSLVRHRGGQVRGRGGIALNLGSILQVP